MTENLSTALLITAIGMGLVFGAILLLWAVMAILVRLTAERGVAEPAGADEKGEAEPAPAGDVELALRQRAAAAAVAIALAEQSEPAGLHEFPLPPTAIVSAWQAVSRARMLNRRGSTR